MPPNNQPSFWERVWRPRFYRLGWHLIVFFRSTGLRYLLMVLGAGAIAWLLYSQAVAPLSREIGLPAGLPPTQPQIETVLLNELTLQHSETQQRQPRLFPASERLFPQPQLSASPSPSPSPLFSVSPSPTPSGL